MECKDEIPNSSYYENPCICIPYSTEIFLLSKLIKETAFYSMQRIYH